MEILFLAVATTIISGIIYFLAILLEKVRKVTKK